MEDVKYFVYLDKHFDNPEFSSISYIYCLQILDFHILLNKNINKN